MSEIRYSVGIDLGTTNSVVSYAELGRCDGEQAPVEVLSVTQLTAPGSIGEKTQLPSFLYQAHAAELSPADIVLPWNEQPEAVTGELARQLGSKTPIRLVASAKSWLSHAGVDRRSPLLPVQSPADVPHVSPLEASRQYLQHLRDAWNARFPDAPLIDQDLVITVPASFDPAARELTVEAAHAVGLHQAILLEEPQSALYSWIQASQGRWREQVKSGDIILVVDVGGGTTDLSLIAVTEEAGNLVLNRVAIGDHILLGGDNMDLALAYVLKAKLEAEGKRLETWQIQALTHGCRDAKEALLAQGGESEVAVVVPSRGSSLISGTLRTSLTRDEVNRTLVEGFFPRVSISDRPVVQARTGLTTLGLPYAKDARITCHLAAFLGRQLGATRELQGFNLPENAAFLHPTAVLLNGGVFKSGALAERLLETLNTWLAAEGAPLARILPGADLDLAVARGAAYYGYIRKGKGVRIRGGTAAAYYVGVESAMPAIPGLAPPLEALCIAPFGMEEGTEADLPPHEFGVVVGEPVHFRFFASRVRRDDGVGTRLEYWADDEIEELEQIEITLGTEHHPAGQVVPVRLAARVTEVGTLQLEAVARDGQERWKVEFNVRATDPASQSDSTDAMVPEAPFAAVNMEQPESQSPESANPSAEQVAVPPSTDKANQAVSGHTERKGRWPFRT